MSTYLRKLAQKSRVATQEIERLGMLRRSVGKGHVGKIFSKSMPTEHKGQLKMLVKQGLRHMKNEVKKGVSAAKSAAVDVVKSKALDVGLTAISAAAGPEGPAIVAAARELGIVDALKTLDVKDWTIDATKLKFPIETAVSGPIAGYNKETGRVKLTAIFAGAVAPINPYAAMKYAEGKTGVQAPAKVEAAVALMGYVVTVLQNAPTVFLQGIQGHGFHYPGTNYIGPGTDVDRAGPPTSTMDALARTHDIHYSYLESVGQKVYNRFNMADRYMLARVTLDTPEGWAVLVGINAKKIFKKDYTPIPPIPSYATVAAQTEIPQDKAWLLNKPQRLLSDAEIAGKGEGGGGGEGVIAPPAAVEAIDNSPPILPHKIVQHQLKILATPHPEEKKEHARLTYLTGLAAHIGSEMLA